MCSMKLSIEAESLKGQVSTKVEQLLPDRARVNGYRYENKYRVAPGFEEKSKLPHSSANTYFRDIAFAFEC